MTRRARTILAAIQAVLVIAIALPLYWTLVSSLAPDAQLFGGRSILPFPLTFEHYRALFAERDFWLPIRNSLIVASATTILAVAIGSICAYALARLRFRGKAPLLAMGLAISMFPQISLVPPMYLALREVGLIDTFTGLVIPYLTFALPISIWLLVGYFRQLPRELEEAAIVDGASRIQAFREVILPLAWPGVATAAMLTFLYCWSEFLFALSFTLGPERYTAPVAIALFRGRYQVPWGQILAAAVVTTVPVVLVVVAFQRRIVEGLTAGAMKG